MAEKQRTIRTENTRQWRGRLQRAERRTGSLQEFCKSEGISRSALKYWQRKPGAFVPVEIVADSSIPASRVKRNPSLPDPRWLAEFILHLAEVRS